MRRLTVMHVITKLDAGGAQETAVALCAGLDSARFDVTLVAGPDRGTGGDMWRRADELGVRTVRVARLVRAIRPTSDVAALVALWRLFRHERPDIVHTHSSKAGVLARVAARLAGVPTLVHTVHGWSFRDFQPGPIQGLYLHLERLLARVTTWIVVVAESDRRIGLANRIGVDAQYVLVRSGVDLEAFRPSRGRRGRARSSLGLPPDAVVVGTVTRLGEPKDPETTVRAFAAVRRLVPQARLVVVGDGPHRPNIEALVDGLALDDAVHLLGARDDVAELLPALDVFVLTSLSEGLPRVLVEAMAAHVPVVATDVGGVGELVIDGETGVLVPPAAPDALADAIVAVLADPVGADGRRDAAVERVGPFDARAMVQSIEELYCRRPLARTSRVATT